MHSGAFAEGLPPPESGLDHDVQLDESSMVSPEQVDDNQLLSQLFGMMTNQTNIITPVPAVLDVCDDIDRLKAVLIHSEDHETYTLLVDALTETSDILQHKRILLSQKHSESVSEQEAAKIADTLVHFNATIAERARQFLATKQEVTDVGIANALGEVFLKLTSEVSDEEQQQLKHLFAQYNVTTQFYLPSSVDPSGPFATYQSPDLAGATVDNLNDLLSHEPPLSEHAEHEVHLLEAPSIPPAPPLAGALPPERSTLTAVPVELPKPTTSVVLRKRKASEIGEPVEQRDSKRQKVISADLSNITKPFNNISNLKIKSIKIGSFYLETNEVVQISARIYHAKKQFVWVFDTPSQKTQKMSINYSDVDAILFNTLPDKNSLCAMTLQLNTPPNFAVEISDPKYTHNKPWAPCDDFTQDRQATQSLEHVLTIDKNYFVGRYGALSHYEKLMLGDPYLCSVARADQLFPPVGKDAVVVGLRTWPQLRDRLLTFFKLLEAHIVRDGIDAHMSYINPNIVHKFKFRAADAPAEPTLAINLDDTLDLVKKSDRFSMAKEEVWYLVNMGKLGENGLGLFYPTREEAAAAAAAAAGMVSSGATIPDAPPQPKAPKKKAGPKGPLKPGQKLIRACVLFAKERLPYQLGTNLPAFAQLLPPTPPALVLDS